MIIGIQQQQTEVGRVRLGVQVSTKNGKTAPKKLDRFRFTSPRKNLLDTIAGLYGGTVEPWQPPKGNQQWQVITNATEVPVIIPPQDPAESQWYEMWSKGGCQRRCDGKQERLSGNPCLCIAQGCAPEARDCKLHTRVRVMLADVPSMGCWRVDTGSYYAAVELPGIAAMLAMAQGVIPGKLVLSQRSVTRPVNGAPQTFNFVVPVLDVDEFTPREMLSGNIRQLITQRSAAAVETRTRTAIAAGPDFPSLIAAAKTVEALYDLHRQAKQLGEVPRELMAEFEARAAEIRDAAADRDEVVEAEIVWPETAKPGGAAWAAVAS